MDELERLCSPSPFDAIRAVLYGLQPENDDDARHLVAGGAFSFESVELFENFAPFRNDGGEPTFVLFVPELLLQIPRSGNSATLAAVVFSSDSSERSENDLSRRLSTIAVKLRNLATRPRGAATEASVEPTTDVDDEAFASRVMKAKEHLARGDAFQIVLSRSFTTPCPDPFDAYLALRQMNPSPYLFYGNEGRSVMFGASPETAVVVDGDARRVEVCPIAGTRARGRLDASTIDLDLDARIEAELRADPKEIAEHMMLVDLARNDVARISQAGSRKVSDLLAVERYSRVMHLVSRVDGILRPELDALHAFAASMPMGTLSGAPKIRAIEIIRELEGKPRGHYGGAVGYLDAAGNMTTSIFIRAAVVREGRARVQAGAGIVLGSEPALEAAETRQKAEAVLRAVAVSQTRRGTHAA
jgi:anthranilate synthase component 1